MPWRSRLPDIKVPIIDPHTHGIPFHEAASAAPRSALAVLACILAAFTHERVGRAAATQLLRGMLSGMAGFVVFCLLVAALVDDAGVAVTFTAATGAALSTQGAVAWASTRPVRTGRSAGLAPDGIT